MQAKTEAELANWVPEMDTPVWERYPLYTSANAQEVYPGVGDPLSFDVNLLAIEDGERRFVDRLGLASLVGLQDRRQPGFFGAFYGHVYINISAFRELVKYLPGGDPDALDEQLFGLTRDPNAVSWRPNRRERLVQLRSLARLLPLVRSAPNDLRQNNGLLESHLQRLQSADLHRLSDSQLWSEILSALRRNDDTAAIHAVVTLVSGGSLENLRKFLAKRGVDEVDSAVAELCTGLADVESAKPARAIWRLAMIVRAEPALREIFSSQSPAEILKTLQMTTTDEGQRLRGALDAFLSRYGYRGVRELGLTTLVWGLRPDPVIEIIKTYLERSDGFDPEANLAHQQQVRAEAMAGVTALLKPWQRRQLRGLVRSAHQGIEGRELAKSQWARSTHALRLLFRELGRRLAECHTLQSFGDLFFLRLAEVKQIFADGDSLPDMQQRIDRRREEYDLCWRLETDERFSGRPRPHYIEQTRPDSSLQRLTGIAVSPGCVRGKARVIRELGDDAELEPGEILVCPFTDAAWTPLFFAASAVVMDLGGPLSHGSTVAREYGLPAVVNVKTGTRMIQTGQEITVNGATGEVLLH